MSDDVPAHVFWGYVSSRLAFCPAVRWCGCPVVRLPGGLNDVLLCPVMPGYARLCSMMFGYVRLLNDIRCSMISDDVRLSPMIRGDARSLRLPGRFGIHMLG